MAMFVETNSLSHPKYPNLLQSDPNISSSSPNNDDDLSSRNSSASVGFHSGSGENLPYNMSPWNMHSPYNNSPWSIVIDGFHPTGLIGSLVREEGHIYSLAASGELLYTGSDSKNIRVWKRQKEYSGFKSSSGLVKAIVLSGDRIFTGHQDGKIRVWKISRKKATSYKRVGTLPKLKDLIKSSMNPKNYVKVRHNRNSIWIRHFDAISCLSLDVDQGILYSGSWDKTLKVWRISDSRCMESINAHDDVVNSVVAAFDGMCLTGSADGSVKVWRREMLTKTTKHTLVQTLLKQECAVTILAMGPGSSSVVYCGSSNGNVNFWERGRHLSHGGVLRGHKLAVHCLAVAGNLVFSGSADKTICVWRRVGGAHNCLSVLTGHTGPVKCLAVEEEEPESSDRYYIVYSGSLDKSVKVWRVSELAPDMKWQSSDPFDGSEPPASSQCSSASSASSRRY